MAINTSRYLAFKMYQKYGFTPEFNLIRDFKDGDNEIDLYRKLKNQYFKNMQRIYKANPELLKDEESRTKFIKDYNDMFFCAMVEQKIYNIEDKTLLLGNKEKVTKIKTKYSYKKYGVREKNIEKRENDYKYSQNRYEPKDVIKNIIQYTNNEDYKKISSNNIDKIREGSAGLRSSAKYSKDYNAICAAASELKKSIEKNKAKGWVYRFFNFRKLGKAQTEYNNLIRHLNTFHLSNKELNDAKRDIEAGTVSLNDGGELSSTVSKFITDKKLADTIIPYSTPEEIKHHISKIGEVSEKEVYDYYKNELHNKVIVSQEKVDNFNKIYKNEEEAISAKGFFSKQAEKDINFEDIKEDDKLEYDNNGNVIEDNNYRRQVFSSDPTIKEQLNSNVVHDDAYYDSMDVEPLNINDEMSRR